MKIVGCDLHTRYQQVAMLEEETVELTERRLEHESGEAGAFYAGLAGPVRVGKTWGQTGRTPTENPGKPGDRRDGTYPSFSPNMGN